MSTSTKLDKDEKGKNVDIKAYRGMIGYLLYLTASRPYIMFSVCLCARFQSCPRESHLHAVKRIFKYLLRTIDLGLCIVEILNFKLEEYSDANFAESLLDRKSTSGICQFIGSSLVFWFSKKQNPIALSTTGIYSVASCCAQIFWMKQTFCDFGLKFDSVPIFCDNTSATNLTKNPIHHSRTKHIDIKHHFIKDHVQNGHIILDFVNLNNPLAHIFYQDFESRNFLKK